MVLMVSATSALIHVITNAPKKLNMAARITARRGGRTLVETAVAMAFGASVQPFTNITARTSKMIMISVRLIHIIPLQHISTFKLYFLKPRVIKQKKLSEHGKNPSIVTRYIRLLQPYGTHNIITSER
jgi:hypothetical protein